MCKGSEHLRGLNARSLVNASALPLCITPPYLYLVCIREHSDPEVPAGQFVPLLVLALVLLAAVAHAVATNTIKHNFLKSYILTNSSYLFSSVIQICWSIGCFVAACRYWLKSSQSAVSLSTFFKSSDNNITIYYENGKKMYKHCNVNVTMKNSLFSF